jgi:hypothetical protein
MCLDKAVMRFAGFVVLVSVALAHFVSPWFLLLTVFRRVQHDPGVVHGLLPGRDHLQEARRKAGRRLRVISATAGRTGR